MPPATKRARRSKAGKDDGDPDWERESGDEEGGEHDEEGDEHESLGEQGDVEDRASCSAGRQKRRSSGCSDKEPPKRPMTTEKEIDQDLDDLKRMKGLAGLTRQEVINILRVYLVQKRKALEYKRKVPACRRKPTAPMKETEKMLGYSHLTVSTVVKQWRQRGELYSRPGRGMFQRRARRLRRSNRVATDIRLFVAERRATQSRVTAVQVRDHLVELGHLAEPTTRKQKASTLRLVQRRLTELGYTRGPYTTVREHKHLREMRQDFRRQLRKHVQDGRRLVWCDESYIHHHYARNENTLIPPDRNGERERIVRHKGRRFCFIAAIQGHNPQAPNSTELQDVAGLVPGSVDIFNATKRAKDYHANFDRDRFIEWYKKLMTQLNAPSVIVMDNAAYHRTRDPGTPKPSKLKKDELRDVLLMLDQDVDPDDTGDDLRLQLSDYIQENVPLEVDAIAEEHGHRVLFLPAHHSDLNPIELTWAFVKQRVGAQYTSSTKFKQVETRLSKEFEDLESGKTLHREDGSNRVQAWIDATETTAKKLDMLDLHECPSGYDDDEEAESNSDDGDIDSEADAPE